jgi:hypothetical protein
MDHFDHEYGGVNPCKRGRSRNTFQESGFNSASNVWTRGIVSGCLGGQILWIDVSDRWAMWVGGKGICERERMVPPDQASFP